MAVFVSDTFTHASNVVLSAHSPEVGGAWSRHVSYSSGDFEVFPASAAADLRSRAFCGASGQTVWINATVPSSNNVRLTTKFGSRSDIGSGNYAAVFCANATARTMYWLVITSVRINLVRLVDGVATTLFSSNPTYVWPNGAGGTLRTLVVEYRAGQVKAWIEGVLWVDFTDPSPLPAGRIGMMGATNALFDDLVAETIEDNTPVSGDGASAGASSVTGVGSGVTYPETTGSAAGVAASNFAGTTFMTGYGTAGGSAAGLAESVAFVTNEGSGQATAASFSVVVGHSVAEGQWSVAGESSAAAESNSLEYNEALAVANGSATSLGTSASLTGGNGSAAGTTSVLVEGVAQRTVTADGSASGSATVDIIRWGVHVAGTAQAVGVAIARSIPNAPVSTLAQSESISTTTAGGMRTVAAEFGVLGQANSLIVSTAIMSTDADAPASSIGSFYSVVSVTPFDADPPAARTFVVAPEERVYHLVAEEPRRFAPTAEARRHFIVPPEQARRFIIPSNT